MESQNLNRYFKISNRRFPKTHRWSTSTWKDASVIIREVEIKTTIRDHLIPVRMAIIKKTTNNKCWQGCEEKKSLCTVGGDVNWYSH